MSNMSHAEAVAFLRACGSEVRLRLYRDHAATPLSPTSPREEGPTDSDVPAARPKPPLRYSIFNISTPLWTLTYT